MTISTSDRLRQLTERAGYSFASTPTPSVPRSRSKRAPRWRRWLLAGGVLFSVALSAPAAQAQDIGPFTYVGRTADAPLTPLISSQGFTVPTFGDVDDDGDDDLLFGGIYRGSTTPRYYEQVSPGVFEERMSHPFEGMELYAPDLVDLDGDGVMEMTAVRPDLPDRGVMLHVKNEAGMYEVAQPLPDMHAWVAWADVDDDGDMDALVPTGDYSAPQLYIQQEPLRFEEQPSDSHRFASMFAAGEYIHSFALHDMDGDGDLDGVEGGIETGVVVHWQVSEGVFEKSARLETDRLIAGYAVAAAVTDFDGDGRPDILLTDAQGIAAGYLQQDDRRFLFDPAMEVNRSLAGRAVDVDRDGRPELVGGPLWGSFQRPISLYRLGGSGFELLDPQPDALHRWVDDVDLDQDGDLDLWDGSATFWAQQADGTFAQEAIPSAVAEVPFGDRPRLRFEDLDDDGRRDVVLTWSGGETRPLFRFLQRTPEGAFVEVDDQVNPFPLAMRPAWGRPAFADMDDDGDLDFVALGSIRVDDEIRDAVRYFERQDEEWIELETHQFQAVDLSKIYDPGNLDLADFDGDGDFDLTVEDYTGSTHLYRNDAIVVADEPTALVPDTPTLDAAYPNPFRNDATLALALPEAQAVRVALYDVLGREVALLHEGTTPAGTLTLRVDGARLASGVYVARAEGATFAATQRLTRLR
ncbi:MAG: FG-GAP-like repeat-containing protein [Bacteroidota bacterium]